MSGNTLGRLFCVTSFGESHGPALGCVVDGCPPGLPLTEADIQHELDRRKPGTSRHVTQRRESDRVEILSGVFEGKTTGTPIAMLVRNADHRSSAYSETEAIRNPNVRASSSMVHLCALNLLFGVRVAEIDASSRLKINPLLVITRSILSTGFDSYST